MKFFMRRHCYGCDRYREFKTFWFEGSALFECAVCGKYQKEGER